MIRFSVGVLGALAVMQLLGWREDVSFLSGTVPATATGLGCGLAYALTWFAAVLVAPVLLVSGAVLRVWGRWRSHRVSTPFEPPLPHGTA